jgi:hypothetical protein
MDAIAKKLGMDRRAADAYPGAKIVRCQHRELKVGDRCPDPSFGGRLYDLNEPKVLLQFTGRPWIEATNYEREVLRSAKCQERYEAPLSEGAADERYEASFEIE